MSRIRLSVVSHTNVGKTTLVRTLLRRDVGEVRDEAHVTEIAESFVLLETPQGDVLELWDTPGFGDSARLLRRLRQSGNPVGWFLSQVWDRYADRPFFGSQQAMRNVRDSADVVLYLVNASESPESAGYVQPEMEILGWIGKPVLVLLNQLGPPQAAETEAREAERWARHLASCAFVRDVLAFDAFARCWVQERVLLARIGQALPPAAREAFSRIETCWNARNEEVFERSMAILARQLADAASDEERVATRSLGDSARSWLGGLATGERRPDPALGSAQEAMARRLDASVRASMQELIELHGLAGRAAGEIGQRLEAAWKVDAAADAVRSGVIGAAVSGALGGLVADIASGGLTFGAGALIGGLLGAAGAHGLARAYNLARGKDVTTLRWSADFLGGRVTASLLRYLAVAHFGRGRGDFETSELPPHWRLVVEDAVRDRLASFERAWVAAADGVPAADLEGPIRAELREAARAVLAHLYPTQRVPG